MKIKKRKIIGILTLFIAPLLFVNNSLIAIENQAESIDPKVDRVIQQASKYMGGLRSLRTEIDMNIKIEAEGMKQEMTSNYSLALKRPDKIAMILKKGMLGATFVCDGKNVYSYTPMTKKYTKEEAPESLSGLSTSTGSGAMDMTIIVKFLTQDNPYDEIMAKVKGASYIGSEEMNGMKCHHLKLVTDETDFDIWVREGKKPLVNRIVPDVSKAFEKAGDEMPAQMKNMKMDVEIVFKNWEVNIDLPDDTFAFTLPESAQLAGGPHPLLDKPAPSFKLELLEGGEFDLSQQKDKNIVILDFWATWCGPCKRVMPIMEEIANEYKDKGVVLIAVDLREDSQKIRSFLQEQDLHPTVALDRDGKVGNLYEAKSIPQTVIIDKDGMVRAVHVGAIPNLKEILKKELDDLLAEKN